MLAKLVLSFVWLVDPYHGNYKIIKFSVVRQDKRYLNSKYSMKLFEELQKGDIFSHQTSRDRKGKQFMT